MIELTTKDISISEMTFLDYATIEIASAMISKNDGFGAIEHVAHKNNVDMLESMARVAHGLALAILDIRNKDKYLDGLE